MFNSMFVTDQKITEVPVPRKAAHIREDVQYTTVVDISADGVVTSKTTNTTRKEEPEYFMKTPPVSCTNTTGIRGVSKVKNGYRADITRNGVQTNLGTYDSFQDAVEARLVAQWGLT